MARPRFALTDEQLAMVPKLAGLLTLEQLADVLDVSSRTLRRRMHDSPTFNAAYRQGRSRMIADVAESLLKQAIGGNVQAQIFYLRTQAGWREADPRAVDVSRISKMSDQELMREARRLGLEVRL